MTRFDIAIVGGGMVGASLAAALLPVVEQLDLSLAIVEPYPVSDDLLAYQPSYDARATALAYGSRKLYEQLGVWSTLEQHLSAIAQIHVSDKGHFGATRLHADEEGVEALGYVVENHWLGRVLQQHIRQHPNAQRLTWLCPAEVTAVSATSSGMQFSVQAGDTVTEYEASLVVIADGGRSSLREQLGITYQQHDYGQHAVVANISPDRPHRNIAYERFTDTGPMALLPLSDQDGFARCGLVWTVPDQSLEHVLALDDAAFMAQVQARFGYRAGRFVRVGERFAYPLKLSQADEQVRSGLVVLGNAAHALHPIAGQGYNLALRGVTALAEHLIAARKAQQSLGDLAVLQGYLMARQQDQQRTIGLSDLTMKLFSNRNPLLALGRDMGLQLLDICPPAKTVFARGAMGLDTPAPRLK